MSWQELGIQETPIIQLFVIQQLAPLTFQTTYPFSLFQHATSTISTFDFQFSSQIVIFKLRSKHQLARQQVQGSASHSGSLPC